MNRRTLAVAIALFAGATFAAVLTGHPLANVLLGEQAVLGFAISTVLFVVAVLVLLTSFDRGRTTAVIRLDWFLPVLRRLKDGQPASHSFLGRLLRRRLPATLQSDRATKRRGLLRRGLRWIGISWLASPVRRFVQALCLLTFAVLFFYVCWPYTATPRLPGRISSNWAFKEIQKETGNILLDGRFDSDWAAPQGERLFVFDQSAIELADGAIGEFQVLAKSDSAICLEPKSDWTPDLFDALVTSTGPWAFHETDPTAWPTHYADDLARKEFIPAELFLIIDPLVSLSTAVASRSWIGSLVSAAIILIVSVLIPRGFCGYVCPLGTTIDFFDWAITGRLTRFRVADDGWWVHIKYYLLAGTMICAIFGVLASGVFSAIPIITRGMLFLFEPLQTGTIRGWHLVPSMNAGHVVSIVLFFSVLSLGFLKPRFWCKYVCPSGAVFSMGNLFRATERKVESTCIHCNKCVEICPFDAIKPDFTTRTTDCTLCQSCGGVCPTHAIKFVERWNVVELKIENDPCTNETSIGRRGFLSLTSGSAAAVAGGVGLAGMVKAFGANLDDPTAFRPVRPPGSVPEREFLEMCIRCGECFKACPNNVLQPEGFQQGLEGLWAPMVVADWAGCDSGCNACGQVCPTGAIRALPMAEKRVVRMGLAIVNETSCLPFAGREECDLCVQECNAAGYHAIEYTQVGTQMNDNGEPIDGTGYLAPVVLADECVGCGLCQTRCNSINVKEKGLIAESAIIIEVGEGREDRLLSGSSLQSRRKDTFRPNDSRTDTGYFLPDSSPDGRSSTINDESQDDATDENPFGASPF